MPHLLPQWLERQGNAVIPPVALRKGAQVEHALACRMGPSRAAADHPQSHDALARGFHVAAADRQSGGAGSRVAHSVGLIFEVREHFVDRCAPTMLDELATDAVDRVIIVEKPRLPLRENPFCDVFFRESAGCLAELLDGVPEVVSGERAAS